MKRFLFVLLVITPCLAYSITRTVSIDGTHQYTTIQTAINACSNGDSVLVYPGKYIENINFNHKSITLASLYARNPSQMYIDSTIVDGNLNTCIKAIYGEFVTINGFTCFNNEQHMNTYSNRYGGIFAENNSHVSSLNCIIRDCTATWGGGIAAGANVILFLSNVLIFNNKADQDGGGLSFEGSQISFDIAHPSSIYSNYATKGMDICFYYIQNNPTQFNVTLNMCSIALSSLDNYFIVAENAIVNVNIQQGYLTQIDQDLYVSPDGDDSNSGISITSPLKTIARAVQRIVSNPDNPHTIHLAVGTYSFSANAQILPIGVKSHIKIIGAGQDITTIDAEMRRGFFKSYNNTEIEITGMTLRNQRYVYSDPIEFNVCSDITLKDLIIVNNEGSNSSGIGINVCNGVIIEDVYIGDISFADDLASLKVYYSRDVFVNNMITANCQLIDVESNFMGALIFDSDVTFRNSIIANNTGIDAYVFSYQTIYQDYSDCTLDMSNVLFYNNTIMNCSWVFSPIYMQNRYQPVHVNNCTIANNNTNTTLTKIYAYADVKNLISYNPGAPGEMYLDNDIYDTDTQTWIYADVSISNSLFRTGSVGSSLPNLVTFTDNIFNGNPMFQGSVSDSLELTQPEYYCLSANSPCINTGTADTTGMNLPLTDLAGNYRVWDNRIDMGCYEYGSPHVANDDNTNPPLPDRIMLSLYPNPVYLNSAKGAYTFIEFTIPEKGKDNPVIEIYNLKGQKVRTMRLTESYSSLVRKSGLGKQAGFLPTQERQDGRSTGKLDNRGGYPTREFYSTVWDCKDDRSQKLSSGIYIVKVTSGKHQTTIKMTILK